MKCYEQGIQKHNSNIHNEFTKSWFTVQLISALPALPARQRVTVYSHSLTRKSRLTHYSALHQKTNSTACHNMRTCRFTPTRPYPPTLSLSIWC